MNKAKYIDHTYLKADATRVEIDKLIKEAKEHEFATVCVNSSWVNYCAEQLKGTGIGVTSVVGFPLGAMDTEAKAFEAKIAIERGATEVDMVINIGKMKQGCYQCVLGDINAVKAAMPKNVLKVIVETALLTENEIKKVSEIVLESDAEFIKTSTGFSTRGASFDDIKIMKSIVGDKKLIKAAGGVKTPADLDKMIELGANRIGTSSGVQLITGGSAGKGY